MLGKNGGKGIRPDIALHWRGRGDSYPYEETFALPRHWGAIIALAVFDLVFAIPAVITFRQASELWQQADSLFNLITALFLTFWLLGWSLAPLTMTALLLMLLFGRESLRARPGELAIELGLPWLGLRMRYRATSIRNLRTEMPAAKKARSWRGNHAVFDYGPSQAAFGINLPAESLAAIAERIETFAGVTLRQGEASQAELTVNPAATLEPLPVAPADASTPLSLASPSSLMLIAANIVPLFGAVFWNWDLGLLMLLYWAESAVIGFFNICKITVIGRWMAPGAAIFFLGHFGGFMAIHFLFLHALFLQDTGNGGSMDASVKDVAVLFLGLWPALLALFISHGFSFFHNFIGRREYLQRTMRQQMSEPYSRIIFMHMVIIFGGALSMMLGEAAPVIMAVILLKTVVDLRAHLKQRDANSKADTSLATAKAPAD
ncbi:DUF6498-containing protein [Pseudohalioglobus lutimaris]|uniref:Uncharacterized protein n=1 Tax=Pseudohalioglobus lutimaris TaxID=1737061 RepID=A0A2N5X118_9GAMM|nr:DUF6498-containing protein [Pseudohalioglobus lutimaris]PLW68184.1 hypothetical protein C0039_13415 [Pseudohalioglobus lutimaris]